VVEGAAVASDIVFEGQITASTNNRSTMIAEMTVNQNHITGL
jgi:hypothetical protein